MCGITGAIVFNEEGKKNLTAAGASVYTLYQRGPDGEGLLFFEHASFGHRRLKIIDTSDKAAQPMSDAGGRYSIVFNGEIFNYRELKKELTAKGITFKSESDTEVLLYLFIDKKEKCLDKLDGEFAFAVYDREEKSLFLARDRFGIKPLYYYADENKFIFASSLKALLPFGIPKTIDTASLRTYLHLNYIPSPHTILEEVKKFPAGCYAKINSAQFTIGPYYSLPAHTPLPTYNYEKAKEKLHRLLDASVKNRLMADVPLGAFLSGGIDSTIICALAARHHKNLHTFSIGYRDEKYFDETHYARIAAKKLGTEHTVFSLSNEDLFNNLYRVLDATDEPFADSSALVVYILSMHTRKHVKVALSGDGADELFGGYHKHAAELKVRAGGIVPSLLHASGAALGKLPGSRNSKLGNKVRQLRKFSEGMGMSEKERYWRWAGFTTEEELEKLFPGEAYHEYENRKSGLLSAINGDFNSILHTDIALVLQNDMLVKADCMSMANSLEVRVPFLDHELVNFACSLPASFKIDSRRRKKILKDAFRNELPPEIYRRGKQGFEVPLLKWFRTELKSLITEDLLSEKRVRAQGIFNYKGIEELKRQLFSSNPGDAVARVWGLVVFQHWWKSVYE